MKKLIICTMVIFLTACITSTPIVIDVKKTDSGLSVEKCTLLYDNPVLWTGFKTTGCKVEVIK